MAEKLGRKWIATDLGKFGIHTTRKRLIGVQRELKAAEKNFRAFEVLNLGRYERQAYPNVGGRLAPKARPRPLVWLFAAVLLYVTGSMVWKAIASPT